MSSFKHISRRFFLLGALASCGFQPALENRKNQFLWGRVELPKPEDDGAFIARQELSKYFGEAENARYRLTFEYKSTNADLAIEQNNIVSRRRITATGRYIATDLETGEELLNQPFRRTASYSTNSNLYAADQALETTERRLIESLAQEFALRFMSLVPVDE